MSSHDAQFFTGEKPKPAIGDAVSPPLFGCSEAASVRLIFEGEGVAIVGLLQALGKALEQQGRGLLHLHMQQGVPAR